MTWTWKRVVELNKLICDASGQPHAVRQEPVWTDEKTRNLLALALEDSADPLGSLPKEIAERHYFAEGNKRTAACLAVCLTLENV